MPGVLCLPCAVGSANVLERHWQLGAPLSGPFSASVSLSVVLAHTQESNFRSGNEKSPSRAIRLQGGLNNAVFQCTGKEAEPFSEQFLNKGKKLSPLPEVLREGTQELKKSSPSLPWQHTPGPASHLGKAPSPVCLCRLPACWGEIGGAGRVVSL